MNAATETAVLGLIFIVLVLVALLGVVLLRRTTDQITGASAEAGKFPSVPATAGERAPTISARPARVQRARPDVAPTPVTTTSYKGAGGRFTKPDGSYTPKNAGQSGEDDTSYSGLNFFDARAEQDAAADTQDLGRCQ